MAYTERISTGCTFSWNAQNIAGLVDMGIEVDVPMADSTPQVVGGAAAKWRDYLGGIPELTANVKLQYDRRDTSGISPNIVGQAGMVDDFDEGRPRVAALVFEAGGAAGANVNPSFTGIIESLNISGTLGDAFTADAVIAVNDPTTLTPL